MNSRRPPNSRSVTSDDLPEAYLRRLLGHRLTPDAAVFSRSDALQQAEREQRRKSLPKHYRLHGRSRRGGTVR
jgi:hypothetical protein